MVEAAKDASEEVKVMDLIEDLEDDSAEVIQRDSNNKLEEVEDVSEVFNPQEIDYDEVARLRTKVTDLESLLANAAKDEPSVLLKGYMETQEASRKEQAEANNKLLTIISDLQEENRELKDKNFEMKIQLEMQKNDGAPPKKFEPPHVADLPNQFTVDQFQKLSAESERLKELVL